ncbi:MAG: YlmH/Sll1252 family protein [Clostridiales bacterium]|nr:YlmH/Sll1252 family protein [Clostridiales bacterium]
MEKDGLLEKRIRELASRADARGCPAFTDFLNLNEQNIVFDTIQKFSFVKGETFGGYEGAERRIAALIPRDLSWDCSGNDASSGAVLPSGVFWPIHCIHIVPRMPKFAEKLSHRDFLGALMHLGFERSVLGDIAVTDAEAYLFCLSRFSELICTELTQVRHTQVVCTLCDPEGFTFTPPTETVRGSIASVRLDTVMALGFGMSRSSLLSLIEGGSVFVNGKLITSNAYTLKECDIVSARGLGRFRYIGTGGQTRKGRTFAEIERFV